MSKPRYNGASPCRGVTYQWFSFISFVNVRGELPSQRALNEKVVEREREEKKNAMQQTVKRVTVKKKRCEEGIIKEQRDPLNYREKETVEREKQRF